MKNLLVVFGTRPEAIKMAPLVKAIQSYPDAFTLKVCITGQHREMLDQVLTIFDIVPDYDLDLMQQGQDLYDLTSRILLGMREVLLKVEPDIVLVHGDTVTSMAASLSAFYRRVTIAHVEAGLRTYNAYSPWPEELNRQLTSRLANFHFTPTITATANLLGEKVAESSICMTGNTVIDALNLAIEKIESTEALRTDLISRIEEAGYGCQRIDAGRKMVLITGHRRENFGDGIRAICEALKALAEKYPEVDFVYPVHLNPNIQKPVRKYLENARNGNVFLIAPLEYLPFVFLMKKSYLILTDSGGIQEEAPSLGKPVLVMRDTTERPEAVIAGTVKLVGASFGRIMEGVSELLDDEGCYVKMSRASNPYGDGRASEKIVAFLKNISLPREEAVNSIR